jgi:hypothetical protein
MRIIVPIHVIDLRRAYFGCADILFLASATEAATQEHQQTQQEQLRSLRMWVIGRFQRK